MGKALYRKYRSKSLDEVIGQEHITSTLSKALKSGKISHAYLFTGPRGVGKTSIARIVAHEINNLPYTDDSQHIDIIEIDAASNRRIDEIRDLREKVYTAPAAAPYKVYIIDEVHMLTKEAFNALLKTLEEPPAHVVFILATTDLHKLPETIISRTQRFSFKPVSKEQVAAHLKTIAKSEGIKADDDALALLAEHGEGSFRDSISMLDQTIGHTNHLTLQEVQNMLGIPSEDSLKRLVGLLGNGSSAELMSQLSELYNAGYPAQLIAKELAKLLRELLEGSTPTSLSPEDILSLLEGLLDVPVSLQPDRKLEIVLLKSLKISGNTVLSQPTTKVETPAPVPKELKSEVLAEVPESPVEHIEELEEVEIEIEETKSEPEEALQVEAEPKKLEKSSRKPTSKLDIEQIWPKVLVELKKHNNTLYGVVRMAQPEITDEGCLRLNFSFAFHQKRLNDQGNRQILSQILMDLTGGVVEIECVLNKESEAPKVATTKQKPEETKPKDGSIDTISNIFGGGELLES